MKLQMKICFYMVLASVAIASCNKKQIPVAEETTEFVEVKDAFLSIMA